MSAKRNAKKKDAFDVYCEIVSLFSKLRRQRAKARKKAGKYNRKTGLIQLVRADKFKKAKRNKLRKIKRK